MLSEDCERTDFQYGGRTLITDGGHVDSLGGGATLMTSLVAQGTFHPHIK